MPSALRIAATAFAATALLGPPQPAHAAAWKYARVVSSPRVWHASEVAMSGNGRVVVTIGYLTAPSPTGMYDGNVQVVAYDPQTRVTTLVSVGTDGKPANDFSSDVDVTADGRYVAFVSRASNLVPKDTNAATDLFVRDLKTRRTTRVSVDSKGRELGRGAFGGAISPNGSAVAFTSCSQVTVPVNSAECGLYLRTLRTGKTIALSTDRAGHVRSANQPTFSATGRYVEFLSAGSNGLTADSTNAYYQQVYVFDTARRRIVLAPSDTMVVQGTKTDEEHDYAVVDPSGTWVATRESSYLPLSLGMPNLRYVLVNLVTGAVTKLGDAAPASGVCCAAAPVFSGNGQYVVYGVGEIDAAGQRVDAVYRRALKTGAVERISGPANACVSDLGCSRPLSVALAANNAGDRVALVTAVRETADDPDGNTDLYLVSR